MDYATWHALEEEIQNARDLDNEIADALQSGNHDEIIGMFDKAMEHKLAAIRLAKSYLEGLVALAE